MQIRAKTGIRRFRGTYTEVLDLYTDTPGNMPQDLDKLLNMWRVIDAAIKVEASKLGYTGDRWLKNCWRKLPKMRLSLDTNIYNSMT